MNTLSLKQLKANKKNSQLSTGPKTGEGKAVVAKNAIKHGIFSKDLIIANENKNDYKELLNNLINDLKPNTQMENILVEKICIDYWRLSRVIRFERSSIQKSIEGKLYDYFDKSMWRNKNNKTIKEIDLEIKKFQEQLKLNNKYIRYLEEGIVDFNQPVWRNNDFETDIEEDLLLVLEKVAYEILNEDQLCRIKDGELPFNEIHNIFAENGYSDKDLSLLLIECLEEENVYYNKEISLLKQQKKSTKIIMEKILENCSLPGDKDIDKIIRYENFLQKAIMRNLSILKKLQSLS